MLNPEQRLATELKIHPSQVNAAVELFDAGNTLPFIARYRKEATGGLDEEQIRLLLEGLTRLRKLDERRNAIRESLVENGHFTDELSAALDAADTITALEDIYQPYRPKRRTRASVARDKGLAPLAEIILNQQRDGRSASALAQAFITAEVPTTEEALQGARDIVAEVISDHPQVRGRVREKALRFGVLECGKTKDAQDEKGVYQTYYNFEFRLDRVKPYQILAINRGESEKVLRVSLNVAERDWREPVERIFRVDSRSPLADQLLLAMDDAAKRLLLPAIERDIRAHLSETAERHAIGVFSANLRGLLTQPPIAGTYVLGIDPGFRTGCKVAVVDPTGKVLETATIYPHEPQRARAQSLALLQSLVNTYHITLIAIGNGTASRETEQLVAEITRHQQNVHYLMVNEAGASVYSASPLARAELPDLDVTLRGAVSIARRAQDPLAELVKIDPKSIGVGLYQHDVNQIQLTGALDSVVETVVNRVGVDANSASPALLAHVSGIGHKLAEKIVTHRDQNGVFANRDTLKQVLGLGPKAFEQAAGFLRIRGDNPLDMSAIHPESYPIALAVLERANIEPATPAGKRAAALLQLQAIQPIEQLALELGTGVPTLMDIFEQLLRPGRDPREDLPPPILRDEVLSMDDLEKGMRLQGTVRNVVDFGAFVDIGVKQDGLLHRSHMPRGQSLEVGDTIEVEVLTVEKERGRIGLGWCVGR
jgi:uncharacterized protein